MANSTKPDFWQRAIGQFTLFPAFGESGHNPLATRNAHWFWEVKVPRILPLDDLHEFTIETVALTQAMHRSDEKVSGTISRQDLEVAISNFAARKGWRVTNEESAQTGKITFQFIKSHR